MVQEETTPNMITPLTKEIAFLKQHFPHCFDKKGDFQFEKFRNDLSKTEINFSKESYTLEWLGRSYSRLLAADPVKTFLKEDKEWNKREENKNSENLLIKGDNLEVLKHLSNAYYEKIKMIYIDPPYNTGDDGFVYEDDRKFTVEEFSELTGVDKEQSKKILSFVKSKSNSHSAWLTFMYPRLYVAKRLLKDDGVIFASIDDNEVAQLKILMDEIFGEENFVDCLKWKRKKQPSFLATHTAKVMEYILVYSKNIQVLEKLSIDGTSDFTKKIINLTNEISERRFKEGVLVKLGDEGYIPKGEYLIKTMKVKYLNDVFFKDGKTTNEIVVQAQFSVSQQKINDFIEKGLLFITKNRGLRRSVAEEEIGKRKSITDLLLDWGDNQDSERELKTLFNENYFDYAKPTSLIVNLVKSNFTENEIILDFFAGSGTTGEAVFQLNAQAEEIDTEGKRKFILVQLPERVDQQKNRTTFDFIKKELKVDEPTIFEITKERLIRAAKKIQRDLSLRKDLFTNADSFDLGFKIFETVPIWEDFILNAKEFSKDRQLFDESKLSDSDLGMLLTTWKTYDNILLTENLEQVDFDGYTGQYRKGKLYLIYKGFETKNLKVLLEKIDSNPDFNPVTVIAFGYNFESKTLRELSESLEAYSNKKQLDIDFLIRY